MAWVDAEDVGSLNTGLAAGADVVRPYVCGSGRRSVNPGQVVRRWLEATGTVVCWCSMTQTILTCYSPSSLRAVQLGW